MKIKIKVRPEDFLVEEAISLVPEKRGAYGLYLLEKRGWNTLDVLRRISRFAHLPLEAIAYGGRKDRYGLTRQYITIKGRSDIALKERGFSLKPAGFLDRPMGPDLIALNKFRVAVRDLNREQIKAAMQRGELAARLGYPNYFDDQRFGSFDARQGFFAEKILKNHLSGALKIYLTLTRPEDKEGEKERKEYFIANWKNWKLCRERASSKFEKITFDFLEKNPNAFLGVLKKIPPDEISFYFAAYQSYIWNETLRGIIGSIGGEAADSYPGVAGNYLFYGELEEKGLKYLRGLELPMLGAKAKMPDALSADIYSRVLENNGIAPAMFNKIKLREAFFKSFPRPAVVKPQKLFFDIENDEIYESKQKLCLNFALPRGSYATMFVKRAFCF